jgi:cytochrome P450
MSMVTSVRPANGHFDLEHMRAPAAVDFILGLLLDRPQWWMRPLRRFWPIARIPLLGLTIVSRFEHVQEVLGHDRVFEVPFARRMRELIDGPAFVLALQDGEEYRLQRGQIMRAFSLDDLGVIGHQSGRFAEGILEAAPGRLDAVEELLTRVPTLLCRDYFGLDIPDPRLFAHWTLAVSAYVFGNPWGPPGRHLPTARLAAEGMLAAIDAAIEKAKHEPSQTIVGRLVEMQARHGSPPDDLIRTELFGMVTGFVPTNTLASAHMLEMLLQEPAMLESAQKAAQHDDDEALWRCLFEALRFKPINVGPLRECVADYTIASGGSGGKRIRTGTRLLVSTQSAMFDERQVSKPKTFDPARPRHEYMAFGFGLHSCIGLFLAKAQITQTFKPLLRKSRLGRAPDGMGRLQTIGRMPVHLHVHFTP